MIVALLLVEVCTVFMMPTVSAEGASDEWTSFRHDASHSGVGVGGPTDYVKLLWKFETGAPVWSSPAVVDGKLLVGCRDGNIYCLDAFSGEKLWSYQTHSLIYYSSPSIFDGNVYVGSDDGNINCVNLDSGELVWKSLLGGPVRSSPVITGGCLYVGCEDDNIYCLNVTNGEKIWVYPTLNDANSSPAVSNGIVYVGSIDNYLYALNATTGKWLWWFHTSGSVLCSPAVADGYVYIGCETGYIYGLNATTGTRIWRYTTGNPVVSSPAIADGRVYVGSNDNSLYCLNATTGSKLWQAETDYWIWSSPAVANGRVYVGSGDYNIYCFNAVTGEKLWAYPVSNAVNSSPALAYGNLYVGCCDHYIYALTSSSVAVEPVYPDVTSTSNIFLFDLVSVIVAGTALLFIVLRVHSAYAQPKIPASHKKGLRAWIGAHPDASCLIAILAFSTVFFINLGNGHLWGADEQTYSQWAYHMFKTGDYLTPWMAGAPSLWVSKPPLAMWFMSLGYQMFGVTNFAVRFFSAVFGTLSLILVFYLGKKLYNRQVGLLSAFVLGTFVMYFTFARHAMTDVALTFFMMASMYCLLLAQEGKHKTSYAMLSGACFGLALLTKQIEAVLVLMIMLLYFVLSKRSIRFVFTKETLLFVATAAVLFMPWVMFMDARFHAAFWDEYFM